MASAKRLLVGMPGPVMQASSPVGFTLNQTTDQAEWIFMSETASAITRVGFRNSGTKTGTDTTWKIGLQGVSGTNGQPDGVWKASTTFGNAAVGSAVWNWFTLDSSYTPSAKGEYLAIVIAYDSGTAPSVGVNDLGVTTTSGAYPAWQNLPYVISNDNGTRSKSTVLPCFGYSTATAAFGWPYSAAYSQGFHSGSSPNIYGMEFTLPAGWGSTFQVFGVKVIVATPVVAGATMAVRIYEGSTVLQETTVDLDIAVNTTGRPFEFFFDDSPLATLNFGTTYHLGLAPSGTSNITIYGLTQATASDWDAIPGGQDFALATFNGTSWTKTATTRPFFGLILDDITEPSGGIPLIGGGLVR